MYECVCVKSREAIGNTSHGYYIVRVYVKTVQTHRRLHTHTLKHIVAHIRNSWHKFSVHTSASYIGRKVGHIYAYYFDNIHPFHSVVYRSHRVYLIPVRKVNKKTPNKLNKNRINTQYHTCFQFVKFPTNSISIE